MKNSEASTSSHEPLFDERYHITWETAQQVLEDYMHPDKESAIRRQQMMRSFEQTMHSRKEGNTTIVTYDDLDLSFLDKKE